MNNHLLWLGLVHAAHACSFLTSTRELLPNLAHINYFLRLRGPDHTGTHRMNGLSFVHNLLHQTGRITPQPFVREAEGLVALFNGEIYNYRTLQKELRPAGPPYASDGECILDAYTRWGETFARRFDGEFAIAVFDWRRQRCIASTDPFGIKPLFAANESATDDLRLAHDTAMHFGLSSYRTGLARAGHARPWQLAPNSIYAWQLHRVQSSSGAARGDAAAGSAGAWRFELASVAPLHTFEVRQHKASTQDWERTFEAAVMKRTIGTQHGVLLPLSSGYDSGAIHLALIRLGVAHTTYSIVGEHENAHDLDLIRRRIDYAHRHLAASNHTPTASASSPTSADVYANAANAANANAHHLLRLNDSTYAATLQALERQCEPYTYEYPHWSRVRPLSSPAFVPATLLGTVRKPMLKADTALVGLAHICSLARQAGVLTSLTGGGADETMTDYGFGGRRIGSQSQFGGYYPDDAQLRTIFPWHNFYYGSQRNYLAKEEYVTGAWGIEGRFPFLDTAVVQEQLLLSPSVKNRCVRRAGWPCVAE